MLLDLHDIIVYIVHFVQALENLASFFLKIALKLREADFLFCQTYIHKTFMNIERFGWFLKE